MRSGARDILWVHRKKASGSWHFSRLFLHSFLLPNVVADKKEPCEIAHDAGNQPLRINALQFLHSQVGTDDGGATRHHAGIYDIVDGGIGKAGGKFRAKVVKDKQVAFYEVLFAVVLSVSALITKPFFFKLRDDVGR